MVVLIAILACPATCQADESYFALATGNHYRIQSQRPMRECAIERECTELEGSCIANAECDGDLVCGLDNCVSDASMTFSGESMEFSCCVNKCSFRGDAFAGAANSDCCTALSPCGIDQGDCDSDDQCGLGLVCGSNNCPWGGGDDCCTTAPGVADSQDACTRENQCGKCEPVHQV
jgi:hypothetical protein